MLSASVLFQLYSESEQQFLALICKLNRTASEENRSLHLRAFREELLSVFQFELKVVLVCVRTEADLLDYNLGRVLLHLLGFLLLLVQVLLVIQNLADRRICLGTDFHQIKFHFISHLHGLGDGIDSRFSDIVTYKADLSCPDLIIDVQFILVLVTWWKRPAACRSRSCRLWCSCRFVTRWPRATEVRFKRRCDKFTLPNN